MLDDEQKAHSPFDAFQLTPTTAFALLLETACEQFKMLELFLSGEIKLAAPPEEDIWKRIRNNRAKGCITMALAKSFVANVVRARRIINDGHTYLKGEKYARKAFLTQTQSIIRIRDVNEHGYDVKDNQSRPAYHYRLNSWGDETSIHVGGSQEILMGPVNLYSIYGPVKRMRDRAGFGQNPQLTMEAKKSSFMKQ